MVSSRTPGNDHNRSTIAGASLRGVSGGQRKSTSTLAVGIQCWEVSIDSAQHDCACTPKSSHGFLFWGGHPEARKWYSLHHRAQNSVAFVLYNYFYLLRTRTVSWIQPNAYSCKTPEDAFSHGRQGSSVTIQLGVPPYKWYTIKNLDTHGSRREPDP